MSTLSSQRQTGFSLCRYSFDQVECFWANEDGGCSSRMQKEDCKYYARWLGVSKGGRASEITLVKKEGKFEKPQSRVRCFYLDDEE